MRFTFNQEGTEIPVVHTQNSLTKVPIPIPSSIPFQPPLGAIPPLPLKIARLRNTARLNPMGAVVRGFSYVERHSNAVSGSGRIDVVRYGHVLRARGLVGVHGAGRPFHGVH